MFSFFCATMVSFEHKLLDVALLAVPLPSVFIGSLQRGVLLRHHIS